MIDGIKASTSFIDPEELKSIFNFKYEIIAGTGEISKDRFGNEITKCKHKGLLLILKEGPNYNKLTIIGSIHKYWNNGLHNFNDFSRTDIKRAVLNLSEELKIKPGLTIVHNLEFGLNITPPIETARILNGMMYHRGIFKNYDLPQADYRQCTHSNFIIKAYDKAIQNNIEFKNIFRFELKFIRMNDLKQSIRKHVIIDRHLNLNNLYEYEVLNIIGKKMIDKWSKIIYFDDTVRPEELSELQKIKLHIWKNPNSWKNFSKQKRLREKKLLYNIINHHSEGIQKQVKILLQTKTYELLAK